MKALLIFLNLFLSLNTSASIYLESAASDNTVLLVIKDGRLTHSLSKGENISITKGQKVLVKLCHVDGGIYARPSKRACTGYAVNIKRKYYGTTQDIGSYTDITDLLVDGLMYAIDESGDLVEVLGSVRETTVLKMRSSVSFTHSLNSPFSKVN